MFHIAGKPGLIAPLNAHRPLIRYFLCPRHACSFSYAESSAYGAGEIRSAGLVACSSRLAPAESEGHNKARSHQLLPSRTANGAATHTLRQ
jgi:hypothetical protein